MLKAAGCTILLLASLGFAYSIRIEMKNHMMLLYEIRKMLNDIFYEAMYSMQPVENILLYSVYTGDDRLNESLKQIGKGLVLKESGNGEEVWSRIFFEKRKELALKEEEAEIIEHAGSAFFGKSMEENQKVLALYLERLDFLIETERKERREKQKVYQTASIMCGLILMILLI